MEISTDAFAHPGILNPSCVSPLCNGVALSCLQSLTFQVIIPPSSYWAVPSACQSLSIRPTKWYISLLYMAQHCGNPSGGPGCWDRSLEDPPVSGEACYSLLLWRRDPLLKGVVTHRLVCLPLYSSAAQRESRTETGWLAVWAASKHN